MTKHDLNATINELSVKLAARSRHVCVLVGAGASLSAGLPAMAGLLEIIRKAFEGGDKVAVDALLRNRSLEEAITRLRRLESVLDGDEQVCGVTKTSARRIDATITQSIITAIRAPIRRDAFNRFGAWASRADYHGAIEIFTTNYDLLIEEGLEHAGASYFDGFVGSVRGTFRPDLVESSDLTISLPASFVRVWKVHGSSNWVWEQSDGLRRVVRLGTHAPDGAAAAVFPSDEKYDDSRRVPFVVLMDRFRHALVQPETILLVTGFSFGDQHLNEIVFDAARRKPRSEFVVICNSKIPDALRKVAVDAKNVTVIGAEEGIVGGQSAQWAIEDEIPGVTEQRRCRLGDFARLAAFLDHLGQPSEKASSI